MRGREVTASPRQVISEERDISDSRNGEIKRPTRCAVHGSLLCYTPCTTWVHGGAAKYWSERDENE